VTTPDSYTTLNSGSGGDNIYDEAQTPPGSPAIKYAVSKVHGGPLGIDTGPVEASLLQKLVTAAVQRVGGDNFAVGLGAGDDAGWFPTAGTTSNGGTVAASNGVCALATSSNASSSALLQSLPVAAFQSGNAYAFRAKVQAPASPTTFQITAYKGGTPTTVVAASFTQQPGFSLADGNYHGWTILYATDRIIVLCDDVPVQQFLGTGLPAPRCNTLDLNQTFEILNASGTCTARWGMCTTSAGAPQDGFMVEALYGSGANTLNVRTTSVTRYGTPVAIDSQTFGSITASGTAAALALACAGLATVAVEVTGTWSATLEFDATIDGTNWYPIQCYQSTTTGVQSIGTTTTTNGLFVIPAAGAKEVRVNPTAYVSGTAVVTMRGSARPQHLRVTTPQLPLLLGAGGGLKVDGSGTTLPVTNLATPKYGTATAMTCTLAALASGAARGATAVQNTAGYSNALVAVSVLTPSSGVLATGYVAVYAEVSLDGTNYISGFSGSDSGVTLSAPPGLQMIGWIPANADASTFTGTFSFRDGSGITPLPEWWSVVIANNTGAAFSSGTVNYQGTNG